MQIMVINGDPKKEGFIGGALEIVAERLKSRNCEVKSVRLGDARIRDCIGCFTCLQTGACSLHDDMEQIVRDMLAADGFVAGAPVRNGLTTACYKRFYERITYLLGFSLLIEDKHTLAISSVGFMGGKDVNRRCLGFQDVFRTRLSDYLFFKVGMPLRFQPAQAKDRLERAADRLVRNIATRTRKGICDRAAAAFDRFIVRKFMLMKNPAQYAHVIECWRQKGYLPNQGQT
jgi:multimeric flavodoxin WrbA